MKKIGNNMRMFLWMTLLTGIIYPLLITSVAQLTMKHKVDGDFVISKDRIIGATLIGQKFQSDKYFWGRPSAIDYNPLPSGGSNLGPISAVLKRAVEERKTQLAQSHGVEPAKIPSELLFASGSGLDPHISIEAAYFQIERVAKARSLEQKEVKKLMDSLLIRRSLGFLGEPYFNVLMLNKALDEMTQIRS